MIGVQVCSPPRRRPLLGVRKRHQTQRRHSSRLTGTAATASRPRPRRVAAQAAFAHAVLDVRACVRACVRAAVESCRRSVSAPPCKQKGKERCPHRTSLKAAFPLVDQRAGEDDLCEGSASGNCPPTNSCNPSACVCVRVCVCVCVCRHVCVCVCNAVLLTPPPVCHAGVWRGRLRPRNIGLPSRRGKGVLEHTADTTAPATTYQTLPAGVERAGTDTSHGVAVVERVRPISIVLYISLSYPFLCKMAQNLDSRCVLLAAPLVPLVPWCIWYRWCLGAFGTFGTFGTFGAGGKLRLAPA